MNFLLTNDDGIEAPGLWTAARVLAQLGKVVVVAPDRDYSGYGPAHPPDPILSSTPYRKQQNRLPGVTAYALSSTPATCAHVGLSGVLGSGPIDLLISGVNSVRNIGRDVLYSGTVGAAMTAYLLGVPAIALSLDARAGDVYHWESAAWAVEESIRVWQQHHQAGQVLLNVNVPNVSRSGLRGVINTSLSAATFLTAYSFERDAHDPTLIRPTKNTHTDSAALEPWSDVWAVRNGFVSITPLHVFADDTSRARLGVAQPVALPVPLLAEALA